MKKITLSEARRQGIVKFFTGKPCRRGHVAERRVSNRLCVECARLHVNNRPRYVRLVVRAKKRAGKNGRSFGLTFKWARDRWNGMCEITGLPFIEGDRRRCASIDRIDNAKG